jgi:hypothetical protein
MPDVSRQWAARARARTHTHTHTTHTHTTHTHTQYTHTTWCRQTMSCSVFFFYSLEKKSWEKKMMPALGRLWAAVRARARSNPQPQPVMFYAKPFFFGESKRNPFQKKYKWLCYIWIYTYIHVYVNAYTYMQIYICRNTACTVAVAYSTTVCRSAPAFISIRQHTSAFTRTRLLSSGPNMHLSAYVGIRRHTSAYVSICAYSTTVFRSAPAFIVCFSFFFYMVSFYSSCIVLKRTRYRNGNRRYKKRS